MGYLRPAIIIIFLVLITVSAVSLLIRNGRQILDALLYPRPQWMPGLPPFRPLFAKIRSLRRPRDQGALPVVYGAQAVRGALPVHHVPLAPPGERREAAWARIARAISAEHSQHRPGIQVVGCWHCAEAVQAEHLQRPRHVTARAEAEGADSLTLEVKID
jgi:hypothetical protein